MKIIFFLLSSALLINSCSSNNQNANVARNANSVASPSPEPTLSEKEKEKERQNIKNSQLQAINSYIDTNYKGWKLNGVSGDGYSPDCDQNDPCDLHLVSSTKSKVVTVILKQFYKPDGKSYWFVREAQTFDLSEAKIKELKESAKQEGFDELTADTISDDLKDEIIQTHFESLKDSETE